MERAVMRGLSHREELRSNRHFNLVADASILPLKVEELHSNISVAQDLAFYNPFRTSKSEADRFQLKETALPEKDFA